ncbi:MULTISPECIES: SRPBCC domain-containing protein [unclassified Kribbella]|uniref:SRPBCC domain-containing protein n=1 Tax=unclassified Kribbella TaxID=2644121 RepID=UPI003076999A
MKKVLLAIGAIVGLVAGYTVYTIVQPFVLHTEIEVDATPEQVWKVLADREAYPEWNPFIISSTGELTAGTTITNVLRDTQGKETTFTPELLAVVPNKELRWIGRIAFGGIFDGEHAFRLEELPGGRTRLIHEETFRGAAIPFTKSMLTKTIEPQFTAMNQALATRATTR